MTEHSIPETISADTDPRHIAAAETATFETHIRISTILFPDSREQVQECVRAANREGKALYPISSGKNRGYGSRVPTADDCALLDLSRMNRILDFNENLGYVTIEPGVTQRQLCAFLQEHKSGLWMDATGAGLDCSIIGNTVERGFGHTPYGDHFSNACGLEVVLPNGEVMRTGFAGLPGALAAEVYRCGVGPSLDGIFSQSNFGIVTRMTIWLMPAPEYYQAYFFQSADEDSLSRFVDLLRPLRMNGTLRSAVHIANDYKVLNGIQQFPEGETQPLSAEAVRRYGKKLGFGRWNGSGGLYGTRRQVAEARRLLRKALSGSVTRLQFLDERMLRLATRFTAPYRWVTGLDLTRTLELVRPVFGLMKGLPTDQPLASVYWRKSSPVPKDPDPERDRCGLLWFAPVAPADGESVKCLSDIAENTLPEFGFEPMISMTMITERSIVSVIAIIYDRDVSGEDRRAMNCFTQLRSRVTAKGYYPYRVGIQDMDILEAEPVRKAFLTAIKKSIDPGNVLAPGRYLAVGEK